MYDCLAGTHLSTKGAPWRTGRVAQTCSPFVYGPQYSPDGCVGIWGEWVRFWGEEGREGHVVGAANEDSQAVLSICLIANGGLEHPPSLQFWNVLSSRVSQVTFLCLRSPKCQSVPVPRQLTSLQCSNLESWEHRVVLCQDQRPPRSSTISGVWECLPQARLTAAAEHTASLGMRHL